MREIHLMAQRPDAEVAAHEGTFLRADSYDFLVPQEPTAVYKPNGELLLRYLPGALSMSVVMDSAASPMRWLIFWKPSSSRCPLFSSPTRTSTISRASAN